MLALVLLTPGSTVQEVNLSEDSFSSSSESVLLLYPKTRTSSWPQVFVVPRSSCFDEIQLQRTECYLFHHQNSDLTFKRRRSLGMQQITLQ